MFYRDYLEASDHESLAVELKKYGDYLDTCVRFAVDAFDVVAKGGPDNGGGLHDSPVILLARHVIECCDGIAVLAHQGCVLNCHTLLRSAFEAYLQFKYILKADSERRGLAYHVGVAHERISLLRKRTPSHDAGQELRKELEAENRQNSFEWQTRKNDAKIVGLEEMLTRPHFVAIEAEWQAIKSKAKRKPEWYALFSGPKNLRELAKSLSDLFIYEFLYRPWSSTIHAGDVFQQAGRGEKPGKVDLRHLRNPDGIESICSYCVYILQPTAKMLVDRYQPTQSQKFEARFNRDIVATFRLLSRKKLLEAPWKTDPVDANETS